MIVSRVLTNSIYVRSRHLSISQAPMVRHDSVNHLVPSTWAHQDLQALTEPLALQEHLNEMEPITVMILTRLELLALLETPTRFHHFLEAIQAPELLLLLRSLVAARRPSSGMTVSTVLLRYLVAVRRPPSGMTVSTVASRDLILLDLAVQSRNQERQVRGYNISFFTCEDAKDEGFPNCKGVPFQRVPNIISYLDV